MAAASRRDDALAAVAPAAVRTGTAGWSIPRAEAGAFPGEGSHLQRYSRVLNCAEINSSFHRPHAAAVYAKWAAMTPAHFRFAVKVARTITHDSQLKRTRPLLDRFLGEIAALGPKLGPLLIQLPPSLDFNARAARTFFDLLRARHPGSAVCEPRHESWFSASADRVLMQYAIGRVAADPSRFTAAKVPGAWSAPPTADRPGVPAYYRLHGSPRKYWSRYPIDRIEGWAAAVRESAARGVESWCVFDNTASGAAIANALEMLGFRS